MHHLFLSILVSACLFTGAAYASGTDSDLEVIIKRAKDLGLAMAPSWLALLHYKEEVLSGYFQSQADDDAFFFAKNGKTEPDAELEAGLMAFMKPAKEKHAQCLFPARWHWLKQQLAIPSGKYDVTCPKLESWLQRTSADELTLVFPSMFLNNPGSMFGHTFLRFDNSQQPVLLSYTLNYAAKADPSDSFLSYAYKGLTGGYDGVFATRAYYETVQLYSDIENRDIWEYQLDYSPEEIMQILRHVWEITNIKFDYFFLKENCSYRLLAILDAVKPEARLSAIEKFPVYAIPVDTVRALDDENLILSKKFRASLATQIDQNARSLSDDFEQIAVALADKTIMLDEMKQKIADEQQRASVLEQTYTILQFREKGNTPEADQILSARSMLPETRKIPYVSESQENGHSSVQVTLGIGENRDNRNLMMGWRPSFHSLLDDPTGYVRGAEIIALDTQLSWLKQQEKLQLEKLRFFNIVSLSPKKDWNKPMSWKINIALERTPLNKTATTLAFITSAGIGVSKQWSDIIFYALADFEINTSKHYDKGHSLLFGWSGGLVYPFQLGQLKLEFEDVGSFAGTDIERATSLAAVNFNISREFSVQFGYELVEYEFFEVDKWGGQVNLYF